MAVNDRTIINLRLRIVLNRNQAAQIISHGLLWRPSTFNNGPQNIVYSATFAGLRITKTSLLRWIRHYLINNGATNIVWSEDAFNELTLKRRAYHLVDLHFPARGNGREPNV